MESASPPIFLRFINLLMNDAVFLLDEALSYMTQLRDQVGTHFFTSLCSTCCCLLVVAPLNLNILKSG